MNSKLIKATASSIALGVSLMGCTQSANLLRPEAYSGNANERLAVKAHEQAQQAMRKGDVASAVTAMEEAVGLSPNDVGYRKTLAELYMRSGRFVSAETTFTDVARLNPGDPKAAFFVAVCQLAQGRTAAALVQIQGMNYSVDAADLGLAYALAGDTRRAISLLEPAARELAATGRVRQNLALAYALDGDWKRARLIAEQDVSPKDLGKRLEQWALLASADTPEARVAMMFGVSPVSDPGQPTGLALAPATPATAPVVEATAAVVEVQPAVVPAASEGAPVVTAAAAPSATQVAAPAPAAKPGFSPASQPVIKVSAALPTARTQLRKGGSQFVVQIGAYNSPDQVERAWNDLVRRYRFIGQYEPLSTTVRIEGKGTFYRLAIAGFESQGTAADLCRSLKAKGGACFVRAQAGDAPVQWASRSSSKA